MYKCLDCGFEFDESKKYSEDCTPGGAFEGGSFMRYYTACPWCAGTYEEAKYCSECDTYYTGYECPNCKAEEE